MQNRKHLCFQFEDIFAKKKNMCLEEHWTYTWTKYDNITNETKRFFDKYTLKIQNP